jgi:hypothetical protein
MSQEIPGPQSPAAERDDERDRISFERLRERTDELELIISGLTLLALLAIPGVLWSTYEEYFARLSLALAAATSVGLPILTAICHAMVVLLALHLAVRAHWVGLIGLKAVFPGGVRWERLPGIGPLTLERLRTRVAGLDPSIARADRAASALFSLITYTAMALAILGLWLALLFAIAVVFGDRLGGVNAFLNDTIGWLLLAYFGAPAARWLLDGVLLRRFERLRNVAPLRGLVRILGAVESLFLPSRLLGITRLTLQSHLLPRAFLAVFLIVVLFFLWTSRGMIDRGGSFDQLGTQQYISGRDTSAGLRSGHYESLRVPRDRLRPTPVIPAPVIETAWLPVFLPYVAVRDDPVLARRCPPRPEAPPADLGPGRTDTDDQALAREAAIDAAATETADCLRRVWQVRLDGVPQSLDGFMPAERADLGLRGLAGWLPLNGAAPGPRRLEVVWRPNPEQDRLDEDYVPPRLRYVIPFLWSPEAAVEIPGGGDADGREVDR